MQASQLFCWQKWRVEGVPGVDLIVDIGLYFSREQNLFSLHLLVI